METPPRVALVASSYHPHIGGVEEHVRHVSSHLRERGHAVEIWTVDRGEHLGRQEVDGLTVRYLPAPMPAANPRSMVHFLRDVRAAWPLWMDAVRDFHPDVLHVQCFGPNGAYASALAHRTSLPLLISSHGETFMDEHNVFGSSRLMRASLKHAINQARGLTGCSQFVLDDLSSRFGATGGVVVPNGVDPDPPHDSSPPLRLPGCYIFSVGRLVEVKGFDLLIRAFAEADLEEGVHLVIGGEGAERDSLVKLSQKLNIADRFTLTGRLSPAQVHDAMSRALMVVVPSRIEAFGIVVLEAWRSGSPLIATNQGGPATIVRHGKNGLLVDPRNTAHFAVTLRELVRRERIRKLLAEEGRNAMKAYSWQNTAAQYSALYEEV